MSEIKLVLPPGHYEELIKEILKQNLDLIVMKEVEWTNCRDYSTDLHIIGSYGDGKLCDHIRDSLSSSELEALRYDEEDRQLIWQSKRGEKSKVFYNISAELAEQLLIVSELN
jgi:hypothetical protein